MNSSSFEPAVIWLTGLSGSGKTTISDALTSKLAQHGLRVEPLDGDKVREIFPATGFSRADRDAHIKRIGFVASRLEHHGVFVVASFVSPYAESRDFVRSLCKRFIEVYVDTPLDVCEQRDPKGLYQRVRRGEIKQFTGVDDPYEAPQNPELRIDTTQMSVAEATDVILEYALRATVA